MNCEVVRTHLSSFMDEALPGDTMADIREHFEGCGSCRDLYLTLRAADRFYSAAEEREVPATYREALRERMGERVNSCAGVLNNQASRES